MSTATFMILILQIGGVYGQSTDCSQLVSNNAIMEKGGMPARYTVGKMQPLKQKQKRFLQLIH